MSCLQAVLTAVNIAGSLGYLMSCLQAVLTVIHIAASLGYVMSCLQAVLTAVQKYLENRKVYLAPVSCSLVA